MLEWTLLESGKMPCQPWGDMGSAVRFFATIAGRSVLCYAVAAYGAITSTSIAFENEAAARSWIAQHKASVS
jgi:hypothetical protein